MADLVPWLALLTLVAVVLGTWLLYRRQCEESKRNKEMFAKIEENIGASAKILEVRNYYEETIGNLRKLLDESFRDGNKQRQDLIKRMMERLDQLKARTFDRTLRNLDTPQNHFSHKRHRRRGGRRHHGFRPNPPRSEGGQSSGGTPPPAKPAE